MQAFGSGRAILVSRETFHEQLVKSPLRCSMPLTEHHRLQFHPLCYLSLSKYLSLPFIFSSLFPSNRATPLASFVVMVLALDIFLYNSFHDFTQCMSLPVYITPVFCIFLYPNTLTNILPLESVFCAMWLTVPLSVSLAPLHLIIISELVFTLHTIPDLLHQSFFHHWINTHDNYCSLAIVTFRWTITVMLKYFALRDLKSVFSY